MVRNRQSHLGNCQTLMLDMDGTLLDLAFDNFMWLTHVPAVYAEHHRLAHDEARERLYRVYRELEGTLDWYCLDHWSERLQIDVLGLHRQHRERISWLPGAEDFLRSVAASPIRVLLVTNSHQDTLALKAEVTGLEQYFDAIYSSHDIGHPKEDQAFWHAIDDSEAIDPATAVFVDDNVSVLRSAATFGINGLLHITRPDTSAAPKRHADFSGIESLDELDVAG